MASKIPEDTLRRLKYPVLAHTNPDGSVTYTHDVIDRKAGMQTPLGGKDLSPAHEPRYDAPKRDGSGKFSK